MQDEKLFLFLEDLPEGNVRYSITQSFKDMNFYVIFVILGLKGPRTAVVSLIRKSGNENEMEDSIEILSKAVPVTVLTKDLASTYLYGISDDTKNMFASVSTLNQFVMDQTQMDDIENLNNDQTRVDNIIYDLERILNFPDYNVHLFGSRVSGLGLPNSDCDFFIDTGGMYEGTKAQSKEEQGVIVMEVYNILKNNPDIFNKLKCVTHARVPILSFKHTSGLKCDLSFRNGLPIENTYLIKRYLNMDPRIKWVVNAIKIWSKQNDLLGPTSFKSYALVWMILHVMMQLKVVIPVAELKKLYKGPSKTVAGWECGYCQDESTSVPTTTNKMSPPELLQHFFYYFGRSRKKSFKNIFLCPLTGQELDKKLFEYNFLTPEFQRYKQNLQSCECKGEYYFNMEGAICVQDPLDLSHNITKNVAGTTFKRFKVLCITSAEQLDKTIGKSLNQWKYY